MRQITGVACLYRSVDGAWCVLVRRHDGPHRCQPDGSASGDGHSNNANEANARLVAERVRNYGGDPAA